MNQKWSLSLLASFAFLFTTGMQGCEQLGMGKLAQDNAVVAGTASTVSSGIAAFQSQVYPKLTAKCAECHRPGGAAPDGAEYYRTTAQETYDLIKSKGYVDFASAQISSYRIAVRAGDGHCTNCTDSPSMITALTAWRTAEIGTGGGGGGNGGGGNGGNGGGSRIMTASIALGALTTTPKDVEIPLASLGADFANSLMIVSAVLPIGTTDSVVLTDIRFFNASVGNKTYRISDIIPGLNGNHDPTNAAWRGVDAFVQKVSSKALAPSLSKDALVLGMTDLNNPTSDRVSLSIAVLEVATGAQCLNQAYFVANVLPKLRLRHGGDNQACINCHTAAQRMNLTGFDSAVCLSARLHINPSDWAASELIRKPKDQLDGHSNRSALFDAPTLAIFQTWIQSER